MNGVVVDGDGLILWENEATGSRKVFKYLLGLWDTITNSKNVPKVRKSENIIIYRIFLYTPVWGLTLGSYFIY